MTIPLKKDKIYAQVGFGWGQFQDPAVAPGGGITWLINDKLRLQAVFPRPALVYQPNDDWDIRALGELNFLGARTGEVHTTEQKLQLDNAVVQYSEYRAGLQVGYSGFKPFKIIVGAGAQSNEISISSVLSSRRGQIQRLTSGSRQKRIFRETFRRVFWLLPDRREPLAGPLRKPTSR